MADPLSIASSVAGLVSLGLTLCGGLHNYFNAAKDRHRDIETASQNLNLLQSNILIIQSSTLKLGHRHALSANGVNQGLANCESQLNTLQQTLLDLTRAEGLSDTKGKLKRQKLIVRYPFDQKKLLQLQDQLSKANATLSNFVQNFHLDISIGISEDLQVLKTYTNDNDHITHNMLGAIARQLDTVGPAIQRNEIEVATISRHIQDNLQATSSCKPDDIIQPRYLRNSQKEETSMKRLKDQGCTCSDPKASFVCREASYVCRSWGGLIISKQDHTRRRHRPGCIFFNQSLQTSKTTFTYLGLRYWLARSLSMSLTRSEPAGAYSLSFGIQSCNIVKSSPAFQAIYDLCMNCDYGGQGYSRFDEQEESSITIMKLKTIYASGAASPFDVDKWGNNIAHVCMDFYYKLLKWYAGKSKTYKIIFKSICLLLSSMFDMGVPITASNFSQKTILYHLCAPRYLSILPPIYDFIETLDSSFYAEDIANRDTGDWICRHPWDLELLRVWGEYLEIAEAFGFNDVFRTIMQRDQQKLAALTMNNQLDTGMLETDVYGRNILHASITWPEGLGLLLQQSPAVPVLCDNESIQVSPLQLAIHLSGKICKQKVNWVLCQDCNCTAAVRLLLEADCCLPVHLMLAQHTDECSLRCKRVLFEHLENRRRRLRDLSLAILPSEIIGMYGVTVSSIPDATAAFLWEELQSRSDELGRQGIKINSGLKPFHSKYYSGGLFQEYQPPEICSLTDEFGIRPSDESGIKPLLARITCLGPDFMQDVFGPDIAYLNWLMRHDINLQYVAGDFHTSVLHYYGAVIGWRLALDHRVPSCDLESEGIILLTKICNSKLQANLPCPCISGAFNRPLASLFSGLTATVYRLRPRGVKLLRSICLLVTLIEDEVAVVDTPYLARCAVHTITMEILGIRHVGPCPLNLMYGNSWEEDEVDEDEWAEVLDEDRLLVEKLADLDEEFEKQFQVRNESVLDFLIGYYSQTMLEVVKEMDVSPAGDYRRGLLAAGVVLEE